MILNPSETIWDRIIRIRTEASWVLTGQLGVAISTLLGVKIITHFLVPSEYGRLAIANTIVLLVGINLFGPLGQGLMRFWSISQEKNEMALFENASRHCILILITVVSIVALCVTLLIFFVVGRRWAFLFFISMAAGSLTGWSGIYLLILTAARKRKWVALFNAGAALAKPLIAAGLIFWITARAEWVILGYCLATIFSLCLLIRFKSKLAQGSTVSADIVMPDKDKRKRLEKEILKFSIPFLIWGSFAWAHQSCDRWALITYHGSDVVGVFAVLTQLSVFPLLFCSSFLSNLFLPIAYQRAGSLESKSAIRNANGILFLTTGLYLAGAACLILITALFHHELVVLISNQNYADLSYLLPGLTIAWALYYLGQTLSGFGLIANQTMIYAPVIVTAGIIALLSTFFFASKSGPTGVVWGLGLAGVVYAVWMLAISFQMVNAASEKDRTT